MVGKQVEMSVPVQIDADIFRDFAAFDVLQRQKRWRRPLVFALAMLVFAVICFSQAGRRPGAEIMGTAFLVLGLGLPLIYFGMFFRSVAQESRHMGLSHLRTAYRVELGEQGVRMRPVGRQDQLQATEDCPWGQVYGAWRTPQAIYVYVSSARAYLLPNEQIPGGPDAAWNLLSGYLPAGKLHQTR